MPPLNSTANDRRGKGERLLYELMGLKKSITREGDRGKREPDKTVPLIIFSENSQFLLFGIMLKNVLFNEIYLKNFCLMRNIVFFASTIDEGIARKV